MWKQGNKEEEKINSMPAKKYPWKKWFNKKGKKRKSIILVRGKHFDGMTHAMGQQVRNAAFKRNVRVSIQIFNSEKIKIIVGEKL